MSDHDTGEGREVGTALVLCPVLKSEPAGRSADARRDEAIGLAQAINLGVIHAETVRVQRPRPATLLGSGAVTRIAELVEEEHPTLVVMDATLTPVQQRNLERAWKTKVIDRTGLILEIFGARARTREGQQQVELAALSYQRSRLVRSWTHLERQRGGYGFLGGPGESQLELDRRLISERIAKIRRELEDVKRTRGLHRDARARVPYAVVALVGYTNAGKSTLFNRLTRAEVMAEDLLFATLDPTMRALPMPSGRTVILSDTVGFISDLPTDLVAAFRATLEEVQAADLILHVRDVAHPDTEMQQREVQAVLRDLGLEEALETRVIEVLNKIDLLDAERRAVLAAQTERRSDTVAVSAATGEGAGDLLALIDARLAATRQLAVFRIDLADGAAIAWLYQHGQVQDRHDDGAVARMTVSLDPADLARFERMGHTGHAPPEPAPEDPELSAVP